MAVTKSSVGGNINISDNTSEANAIFIADKINVGGTTTNQELIVNGNLVTSQLTNNRKRAPGENDKPALYVVKDMNMYMKTLDFMSRSTYEWTQLK